MCGRSGRGKRTEPTGKFSPAARAATSESSTRAILLESRRADRRPPPTRFARPLRRRDRQGISRVGEGDTLVVTGEPEHRELLAAVAVSAYKAGATYVDVVTSDPLVTRARSSCMAATTRSGRSRRGHDAASATRPARGARCPTSRVRARRAISTVSRRNGSRPTSSASRSSSRSSAASSSTWRRAGRSPRGLPTTGRARSTRTSRSAARSGNSRRTSSTSAGSPTPTGPGRAAGRSTSRR